MKAQASDEQSRRRDSQEKRRRLRLSRRACFRGGGQPNPRVRRCPVRRNTNPMAIRQGQGKNPDHVPAEGLVHRIVVSHIQTRVFHDVSPEWTSAGRYDFSHEGRPALEWPFVGQPSTVISGPKSVRPVLVPRDKPAWASEGKCPVLHIAKARQFNYLHRSTICRAVIRIGARLLPKHSGICSFCLPSQATPRLRNRCRKHPVE